jgi:hypothetical protein
MTRLFVTGGRQRGSRFLRREEWTNFATAVLLELDTETGASRVRLEYESPPGRCPERDASHVFKAASWDGDKLLLCTQTEVVVFDPRADRVERTISHRWFNDVHHVARLRGKLHVVSTGLDALLVLDDAGQVTEVRSAGGAPTWQRFDPTRDYRLVPTTKPHECHPNYVFEARGSRWLTRFEQRDAVPLDLAAAPIRVAEAPIHDGVPFGGSVWFTAVSGQVVEADAATGATRDAWDLSALGPTTDPLGWCRGILVEDERVFVGFSRIRPTEFKQNLAWLRAPLNRPEPRPTRVAAYDLRGRRELGSWNLEEHGVSAVFSVLPALPP